MPDRADGESVEVKEAVAIPYEYRQRLFLHLPGIAQTVGAD